MSKENINTNPTQETITEEDALFYHSHPKPGKLCTDMSKSLKSETDFLLAYTPGVSYPCKEIAKDPQKVYHYTNKGNLVAMVSNGTAVLGLGNIGPEASKPVMEGKAALLKKLAGIDCFDIEIASEDPKKIIDVVQAISPTFGAINLEDIKAPDCFEIEKTLQSSLSIPVMHDDQHGTAIVTSAGLINSLSIVNKNIKDITILINGAGAAAIACANLYTKLGVSKEQIIMCDSKGVITTGRTDLNQYKRAFATSKNLKTLSEAIRGVDVFIGVSVADVLSVQDIKNMAKKPIIFALANPNPEITYDLAVSSRKDIIIATGRSDYPNQINNVLGYPYIFRGALDVQASTINEEMQIAAVHAIASIAADFEVTGYIKKFYNAPDLEFGPSYILPKMIDPRLLIVVSQKVAKAAIDTKVARKTIPDWHQYKWSLARIFEKYVES